MSNQLERCKKSLRSILLANKGGVPARQIMKEYQSLYEERIPYQALGFSTLGNNYSLAKKKALHIRFFPRLKKKIGSAVLIS